MLLVWVISLCWHNRAGRREQAFQMGTSFIEIAFPSGPSSLRAATGKYMILHCSGGGGGGAFRCASPHLLLWSGAEKQRSGMIGRGGGGIGISGVDALARFIPVGNNAFFRKSRGSKGDWLSARHWLDRPCFPPPSSRRRDRFTNNSTSGLNQRVPK